jgi:hypothetical protein
MNPNNAAYHCGRHGNAAASDPRSLRSRQPLARRRFRGREGLSPKNKNRPPHVMRVAPHARPLRVIDRRASAVDRSPEKQSAKSRARIPTPKIGHRYNEVRGTRTKRSTQEGGLHPTSCELLRLPLPKDAKREGKGGAQSIRICGRPRCRAPECSASANPSTGDRRRSPLWRRRSQA